MGHGSSCAGTGRRAEPMQSLVRRPILTANYAGSTGGSDSAGTSAFWDERGGLVARADAEGESLVVARQDNGEWRGEVITDL